MKPVFLIFFSILFVTSMSFAAVYTFWTELVESNPAVFAVGLVSIITICLMGMLFSISSYVAEKQRSY